ncbi:antitoxin [Lactococcus lactis]|uniref:antitoxin n=1 Tax=Lactococcus lactis TaxID=1358 RepID=UPI00223A8B15|nr:antitoxin [Lactococcus lactis]MCT1193879.1 antitoxin [Lactococcus lactis]
MNATQQVNFRADSNCYNLAKNEILQNGMSVSDVFNATLRKIATGAINPREFVQSDTVPDDVLKTAFADLKREILVGHEAILSGNTTKLSDVRKEFNLD